MIGERRHETCRFGRLTEAWSSFESGHLSATVVPLCLWEMPEPAPPAAVRGWGGRVEPERDCAACPAWCGVEATAA